jgi:hypothetical protein
MKFIETQLVLDIEHNTGKACESDGEACDIYQRRKLVFNKIATGDNNPGEHIHRKGLNYFWLDAKGTPTRKMLFFAPEQLVTIR